MNDLYKLMDPIRWTLKTSTRLHENSTATIAAADYLERSAGPTGLICPHCGEADRKPYRLKVKRNYAEAVEVRRCRKQFTVTVGTIFQASHIPLNKWLLAFYLLCASKKGMSAHQLHGCWSHLQERVVHGHRIRWAMAEPAFTRPLAVAPWRLDETYVGRQVRRANGRFKRSPIS